MLGYESDEMIGQNIFGLVHPDDLAYIQPLFQRIAGTSGARSNNSFRLRHKNGSWRWIESVVTNLLAEPSVQAIVANYHDITERTQAEEDIKARTEELATLYDLSRTLAETSELDQVLDLVNRQAVECVHTTFARIALLEGDELVTRSAYPIRVLDHNLFIGSGQPITAMPICRRIMGQDEPIILSAGSLELSPEERAALLLDFAKTLCLIPLRVHDFAAHSSHTLGLLMLGEARHEEREPFTPEKIRLARSIGDQAAIAIDNSRLFNDLERSNVELSHAYDATIAGWSAALDLRDKETEGHTLRVTEMSHQLAKRMGFSEQELVQVRRGALLHDIGKMGVPDRILHKPGPLTDEEWVIMRMHPSHAFQMLKPITYLRLALDIPYCHHEKWDGTGYPARLKGGQIPLAARIFAIIDVYDALTSDRPYRKSWSHEITMKHIRELSGSHFDPQVVDAFWQMMEEKSRQPLTG
jgi:PAS domain S-box-containing protein/putative nucleotidyltransferase with HDIG domain